MLMQLRSIDKRRTIGRYGWVKNKVMRQVNEALKVATGLARL